MSDKQTDVLFLKALDAVVACERKALYVFESVDHQDKNGSPLYWNDEHGLVSYSRAQVFKEGQNPKASSMPGRFKFRRK